MPDKVFTGKNATVFTVDSKVLLGKFRTCEIRVRQDNIEIHGPQDDYEMRQPRRIGCSITLDQFIPNIGGATSSSELAMIMPYAHSHVAVVTDMIDGRTFSGTFFLGEDGISVGDDESVESITMDSHGTFTHA